MSDEIYNLRLSEPQSREKDRCENIETNRHPSYFLITILLEHTELFTSSEEFWSETRNEHLDYSRYIH